MCYLNITTDPDNATISWRGVQLAKVYKICFLNTTGGCSFFPECEVSNSSSVDGINYACNVS